MSKKRKSNQKKNKRIVEQRKDAEVRKLRSFGELRAVEDDGVFEGYLTVWGTIDSYNSTFKRGSFLETIEKRGSKVKVFYDHEHLVGSSIELREDDHGVYGKGKLNLDVEKAREAHSFMKDGTLEGLSFRFITQKDSFQSGGVRMIEKLELLEYGPVVFPSNENADITSVRSEDFDQSLTEESLYSLSYDINSALRTTLSDIWWSENSTSENIMAKFDSALSDHHAAYMEFASKWLQTFWNQEKRSDPCANALSNSLMQHITEERTTIKDISSQTSLTVDELKCISLGNLIDKREKLSELPSEVLKAHQEQRNADIEKLCVQLRSGLTESEKRRMKALLTTTKSETEQSVRSSDVVDYLKNFTETLGEK